MQKIHDARILEHPAVWYSLKLTGRKTPSNYITVISEITKALRTPILPERFFCHLPRITTHPLDVICRDTDLVLAVCGTTLQLC